MSDLIPGRDPSTLTMSSREISTLVESRHDKVKQSIERLAEKGLISFTPLGENSGEQGGRPGTVYHVNKRDSYIVVAQLCPEFTARLVDRWQELEEAARQPFIDPLKMLNDPKAMRDILLAYTEKVMALEDKVSVLAPKAAALDRITADPDSLTITQAAKALGITVKRLTTWLHAHGWIYRQNGSWLSHSRRITSGDMVYKEARYTNADTGDECLKPYCHLTPKGFTKLAALIKQEAA